MMDVVVIVVVLMEFLFVLLICIGSISRVSDQNGVSLLYIVLEIHHSGREPSIWIY